VPETVLGLRAVRACSVLQVLEVADGADVVQSVVLAKRDAGGVLPPVLEPLEPVQQQGLRLSPSHVADDPAHPKLLSLLPYAS